MAAFLNLIYIDHTIANGAIRIVTGYADPFAHPLSLFMPGWSLMSDLWRLFGVKTKNQSKQRESESDTMEDIQEFPCGMFEVRRAATEDKLADQGHEHERGRFREGKGGSEDKSVVDLESQLPQKEANDRRLSERCLEAARSLAGPWYRS